VTAIRSLLLCARSVSRDERGVTFVEFAFLAPILAVLVAGIVDLSMGMSHRFSLQQAVNRSLEVVQANRPHMNSEATDIDYTYLATEAAAAAGVTVDKVTLTKWRECNGVKQATYTGFCPDGVELARYVRVSVTKNFTGRMYIKTATPVVATAAVRVQ
jgi:Flp pilus assembly protein TadG